MKATNPSQIKFIHMANMGIRFDVVFLNKHAIDPTKHIIGMMKIISGIRIGLSENTWVIKTAYVQAIDSNEATNNADPNFD